MDWRPSVYSDGSPWFLTPAVPALGQEFTVRLQMLDNPEVTQVVLRLMRNGSEVQVPLAVADRRDGLKHWSATTVLNQPELNYHFYILTATEVLWYTQAGLTDVAPTEDRDFKLRAGYAPAPWVRTAVFYQIFPDRFCNGDPTLTVKTGEYEFDGHPTVQVDWSVPPKDYSEVFCLDFYGGDLSGIESKIDYFREVGVTALYLNPIFRSATSHRYDCLDYFHVDPHLGGDEALARLSAALKAAGIRLVLDVSINHTGTAHPWFQTAFRDPKSKERGYYYFDADGGYHPWAGVPTLPTLNYTNPELRGILYRDDHSVVRKWLRPPFSIDAWRFDVANDMAKKDEVDLSHEVWQEIRRVMADENPDAYLLAEHWTDSTAYEQGGEWDSAMNYFGCARPIRQWVGLRDLFLTKFEASGALRPRLTADRFARWITAHLSRLPWQNQMCQFNLLGSHDTDRLHNNPEVGFDRYQAAVILMYLLPGAPNIYYGDEVGLDGRTDSNEGFRYPMEWNPTKWKPGYVDLYRRLSALKRSEPALHDGGFQILAAEGFCLALARFTPGQVLVAVTSMEAVPRRVAVPLQRLGAGPRWEWTDALDQDAWSSLAPAWTPEGLELTLPPGTGRLLKGVRR